jgi:hypothetical protein
LKLPGRLAALARDQLRHCTVMKTAGAANAPARSYGRPRLLPMRRRPDDRAA